MKSSFNKLKRLALSKNDNKDKIDFSPSAQVNELAQAAQDMQEMKDCYDSLLSAAAATANSAYEFSESLREMGSCFLEKTSLWDDDTSGNVLLMLGKVQLGLQKLFDTYRSHIFLTITDPSESLLSELRTVEDMKRQCDEKREVYEYLMAQHKEKGRSKSSKGENFTLQQLQTARDEYDAEATLCIFRLKSLKQGQHRSLLTQAARHHAAQLNFFRKGLRSLEAVDAHVRLMAEQEHIDYPFCGNEDNDRDDDEDDGDDDGEDGNNAYEDGELSFDYRRNKHGLDASTSRNSMEVDEVGLPFPLASAVENAEVNLYKTTGDHNFSSREPRRSSFSAPILVEKKIDPAERIRQLQQSSSTRKSNTYVLPTPIDPKIPLPSRASTSSSIPHTRSTHHKGHPNSVSHSSPLDQMKQEKDSSDHVSNGNNNASLKLPPPLAEGLSLPRLETSNSSLDTKKNKRQAYSGPITSKSSSTKPISSSSGLLAQNERPQSVHPQPSTSPKVSPTASPPLVSSPRISELHELPRPPPNLSTAKSAKSPPLVGHSAPLVFRNQDHSTSTSNNKIPSATTSATPLPIPPLIVPRSFSIPSSSQRAMSLHVSKLLESPKVAEKPEDASSPPLTPISFKDIKPASVIGSEVSSRSAKIRGD